MTEACNIYGEFNPAGPPAARTGFLNEMRRLTRRAAANRFVLNPEIGGGGSWLESRGGGGQMNIHEHVGYHLRPLVCPLDLAHKMAFLVGRCLCPSSTPNFGQGYS